MKGRPPKGERTPAQEKITSNLLELIYSDEGDLVDPGQRLGLDVDTERRVLLGIDAEVTEAILAAR